MREVLDLSIGEMVPEDVSVLVVARPRELPVRAAFAIDQFLQRGGRVDLERTAEVLLRELRSGNLGRISFELPEDFEDGAE